MVRITSTLPQAKAFDITQKKTFTITQNDVRLTVQVPDSPVTAEEFLMRITINNFGNEPIFLGEDGRQPFCNIQIVTTKGERCALTTVGENTVGLNIRERVRAHYARLAPLENMSWTFPIRDLFKLKADSYVLKVTFSDIGQVNGIGKGGVSVDNVAFTIKRSDCRRTSGRRCLPCANDFALCLVASTLGRRGASECYATGSISLTSTSKPPSRAAKAL